MAIARIPEWGTLQQAAERRAVSVRTIRRYISQGLIEAERFGPRLIRVDLNCLDSAGRPLRAEGGR
jgi:excisionase family DNA binding protein